MQRKQRDYFDFGGIYHIYNRTIPGKKLYESEDDYLDFLDRYKRYFVSYFDTYAYCLTPNHFHFLIKVKEQEEIDVSKEKTKAAKKYLSREVPFNFFLEHQLSRMFSGIAVKYNNRQMDKNQKGVLFGEPTKRVLLKTESRVIYQLCYIHHNVIHHHLGKDYSDWKYTSYQAYINDNDSFIDTKYILELLGSKEVFLELHKDFKLSKEEDLFAEHF